MTCRNFINGKEVPDSELSNYYISSPVISKIIHDVNRRIANQDKHDLDDTKGD